MTVLGGASTYFLDPQLGAERRRRAKAWVREFRVASGSAATSAARSVAGDRVVVDAASGDDLQRPLHGVPDFRAPDFVPSEVPPLGRT